MEDEDKPGMMETICSAIIVVAVVFVFLVLFREGCCRAERAVNQGVVADVERSQGIA